MTEKNIKKYFDNISNSYDDNRYSDTADQWHAYFFSERLNIARTFIKNKKGIILDIGSGPRFLLQEDINKENKVIVSDISLNMIKLALSQANSQTAINMLGGIELDTHLLPIKSMSIDIVVCLGVVTYLRSPDSAIVEMGRILKKDGTLILSLTNSVSPDTIIRKLFKKIIKIIKPVFPKKLIGNRVLFQDFKVQSFTEKSIAAICSSCDLVVEDIRYFNYTFFPFNIIFKKLSLKLAAFLKHSSNKSHFVRRLASDMVVLARKR